MMHLGKVAKALEVTQTAQAAAGSANSIFSASNTKIEGVLKDFETDISKLKARIKKKQVRSIPFTAVPL